MSLRWIEERICLVIWYTVYTRDPCNAGLTNTDNKLLAFPSFKLAASLLYPFK